MALFDISKKKDAPADPLPDRELAQTVCREIWAGTARPAVCFTLEDGEPGIFDSKVGGTPYLPHGEPWPLDANGGPMDLLAQIDCAALSGLPDFPHTGLLQFFIARDDVFGADFDDGTAQTGFRVFYREQTDPSVTEAEVQAKRPPAPEDDEEYYSPILIPSRIVPKPAELQGMTQNDYRFDGLFTEKWNARRPEAPLEHHWELMKRLQEEPDRFFDLFLQPGWTAGGGHRLGGWPFFTQDDPREEMCRDLDVLLFQLDSDFGPESQRRDRVLWGDCGVCNFFISREALKNRDFSRVLYNWDCC